MPQIDQLSESWYAVSQLFWLALVFGAIFVVIGRGMLPKVEATVDARDRKIADDVSAAKAAREAADAVEADWRAKTNAARAEAQAVVAAAKSAAADKTAARLASINEANEARLAAAEAEISAARVSALAEIEAVAADAAQHLVSRLTGKAIEPEAAAAAVRAQIHA